jgi:2,4-dienoyl-CoA reductase-like NADH-dependent reductase (Old Yellow Enzyme family)
VTSPLFQPFTLGPLHLANRIVMAPMTRSHSPNGIPGPDVAAYYERRAAQGVGLIITEGTLIGRPEAGSEPDVPFFAGHAPLAAWAQVLHAVHAAGGKIMPQLWHAGIQRKGPFGLDPNAAPFSPSGINSAGEQVQTAPGTQTVEEVIAAFAESARQAHRLGFDGVEFHGAHGYLIDQFFWERTNRRTDRFGGGLVQRTRFACDVISACRQATAPDFPLIMRFSQWKVGHYDVKLARSAQELETFLAPLAAAGVDIFHCSQRRFWEPEFADSPLNLAGWTKKLTGKPVITVGSIGLSGDFVHTFSGGGELAPANLDLLDAMLSRGEIDLAAIGRALIGDPAWAAKVRSGQPAVPFHPDSLAQFF